MTNKLIQHVDDYETGQVTFTFKLQQKQARIIHLVITTIKKK